MITTTGIHHVTAVTASIQQNVKFYTNVLGLRLVKKTANQDDVSAYHLFYADAVGSPGSDMTFFDWSQALPLATGSDQISRTYFRVSGQTALDYWQERLAQHNVNTTTTTIANCAGIHFTDPEGQRLGLIVDDKPYDGTVWDKVVPPEHALRGFAAIELSVPDAEHMADLLSEIMNWSITGTFVDSVTQDTLSICSIGDGGPGNELYIREEKSAPQITSRAGSVHHVAFRVPDEATLREWIIHLEYLEIPNSGVVDRFYFTSLYFRISDGILFELATDGPGFATDEDPNHLGEALSLPPFLEPHRQKIERGLTPLG